MNTVAPIWDGNETWLIIGGGGLFAAFPLAYSVILPALYAPLTAMLIGLILRGVAFEFRWKNHAENNIWDKAFIFGSIMATFMQGVTLGAFLQGMQDSIIRTRSATYVEIDRGRKITVYELQRRHLLDIQLPALGGCR